MSTTDRQPPAVAPAPMQDGERRVSIAQAMAAAVEACRHARWEEAERICRLVLGARPGDFDALNLLGMIAVQKGEPGVAADFLGRAVAANPGHAQAQAMLGGVLLQLGRHAEALASLDRAIEADPGLAQAHLNRGIALAAAGRAEEALEGYGRAIALQPGSAEAHYNRGLAFHALGRHGEALASVDRALELNPGLAQAHNNRGVVLRELGRLAQALECHERAIALDPGSAEAHSNRGVILWNLRRHAEAIASYERALALRPEYPQAWFNLGSALGDAGRHADALKCLDRAVALAPRFAAAHVRRAVALRDLGRHAEALEGLDRARGIDPDLDWLEGLWLHARMRVCDWADLPRHLEHLLARIERGDRATPPFPVLALTGSAAIHRKASETWVAARLAANRPGSGSAPGRGGQRIRIGYFSADYFEHATSYLVAGLLEAHDRAAFEVTAYSFGPDTGDDMRKRVAAAVERFVDVRSLPDEEVARLARSHGIDIAVDLKGFTEDARTGIFAWRAAPIQVNYLGYPGTLGADFIDYVIADDVTIPEAEDAHYAEKVVRLPGSYQANDSRRRIAERAFTRAEEGLPEAGFVFCCFNNSYKILPATFDIWMRLLGRVEASVLWLLQDSEAAAANLRAEAARRGIAPQRLVFARRLPVGEHLARHRLADLFLDTLPYNAHTTASDALWAGLPVLTCLGDAFAGRVAASLLRAAGLPELVADSPQRYEALALELAADAAKLGAIRNRLAQLRASAPLFDTRRFTRHLEAAFAAMVERHRAGLPPQAFRVAP